MNKTIKNHMKTSIHLTLILLLFFGSFHLTAGTYSGGNGTVNDPYQIATYADLLELSATSADWATGKYFIQTAHIDASATATLNGGKGFVPIGNLDYKFQGSYDGQHYTISNLYINRSDEDRIAMFGYLWGTGISVQNLGLTNVSITGKNSVAALAGYNRDGIINNCYSSGSITGYSSIGGLVATNYMATITNSYSTCSVSGTGTMGGCVGVNNQSVISRCYATGSVTGLSVLGGFVGSNKASDTKAATISHSYSTGNVVRTAAPNVKIGGFCGTNELKGAIQNCYSTGSVNFGTAQGFLGENITNATFSGNFYDSQTSKQTTGTGATARTTAQMKTESTFTNWDFTPTTGVWNIQSGTYISYPYLQVFTYDTPGATPAVQPIPGLCGIIGNAGTITGETVVCQGQQSVVYTVPEITHATSYTWTLPSGSTGSSTSNSITVNYGTSAKSGTISVRGVNACSQSETSSVSITVNPLPTNAGVITGESSVCQGETAVTYTVPTITHATEYVWTLPTGATGSSTTNSITVDYGSSALSGDITVKGTNACGDGVSATLPITVSTPLSAIGAISGPASVCVGQTAVTYQVPEVEHATSYSWTLPTGITGSSTTNSITVDVAMDAVDGEIAVKATNLCGDSQTATLQLTVHPLPSTPIITQDGANLQSDATSGNQWYNQNGIIMGETNQFYEPVSNGDYYVIVSSMGCQSAASNTINITFTQLHDTDAQHSIVLYPNPVVDELKLVNTSPKAAIRIQIYDTNGKLMYQGILHDKLSVPTTQFEPGTYLVHYGNEDANLVQKIIKK